jgi:8-oxo-dGTP pyrophosphatase MutT (NUDIX family)
MAVKSATSSGAIILREFDGTLKIALAHHDRPDKSWVLPKGHVEEGETIEQAALREIYEETGLQKVQLLKYLGSLVRKSQKNRAVTRKIVHYYLAYALEDGLQQPPPEDGFTYVSWFPPEEAIALLPYKEEQEFVKDQLLLLFP